MRFLMVDEILLMEPGRSIAARKWVAEDEDYFLDHFPGFPVVPGVLLVEMMAQAAGKCLDAEKRPRGRAMLAQINAAKFRKWVSPGSMVVLSAVIKANRDAYATAQCKAEVDGEGVGSAELLFTFVPAERFASSCHDEVLEKFLRGKEE